MAFMRLPNWFSPSTLNSLNFSWKLLKRPKKKKKNYILKNKQNTRETTENNQNTPKLSQNRLNFLDFGGIFVGFKLFFSF